MPSSAAPFFERVMDVAPRAREHCWRSPPTIAMNETASRAKAVPLEVRSRDTAQPGCAGTEPYALMVVGHSMRPEFEHGDIVVVEPEGLARDGSFVIARCGGEWLLCALRADGTGWRLATLDGSTDVAVADLDAVHGVVIQKSRPGRRRAVKRYID